MAVLRVVDRRVGDGRRITVSWLGDGSAPQDVETSLRVPVDEAESDRVRWYLEEYAEFPAEPGPARAAQAVATLDEVGRSLFSAVFTRAAERTWAMASAAGSDLRVEVDADPGDVPGLPWELLRDPVTGEAVALRAGEFVRTHRQASRPARLPQPSGERLRVLLVICRPDGRDDVPFRSVASRLVRGGADRMERLDLTVLRPPTFARLAEVLRAADRAGDPYHVVHFDGHGAFLDAGDLAEEGTELTSSLRYGVSTAGPPRAGRHGYLIFEDPKASTNQQLVDGPTLASLLVEAHVPVVVLNACRSAYGEGEGSDAADAPADVRARVRAYGSLAAEVADAGVPGVVAMRYNVYVVTAAQFVADLYGHLVAGESLGFAASRARKSLADDPTRLIGATPVSLQDWVVPTVYEAAPLRLLAPRDDKTVLVRIDPPQAAVLGGAGSAGFFGRDETLLALDRAFDTHRVVLLHALAGAGKTSTAREFARWYTDTGGAGGVLWTSFEHHLPLARVLDTVGVAFSELLEARGVHWSAITDEAERRQEALRLLSAHPVLWVWDNVEPVAGFPAGTPSAWTGPEQEDLAQFLAEVARTRARVLLTSRRDEEPWLGSLPFRVRLPRMPLRERLQLAHALAPEAGAEVDWQPLLEFTGGNPLTITVAVRQVVREHRGAGLTTAALADFVDRVRAGLAPLEDGRDAALGRDRSLAASLDYGFRNAFTAGEQASLAVLHLFRDTVDADALRLMGDPELAGDDAVAVLAGVDRARAIQILDRAVDVGLLTGNGGGYYAIHPALPWYFTALYQQHITDPAGCERAYCRAYAALGNYYVDLGEAGQSSAVLPILRMEEANLRHAVDVARARESLDELFSCLHCLETLYRLTGRSTEWGRLVNQTEADSIDPTTDQPLPGREKYHRILTTYQVQIALQRRDWPTATRLQTTVADQARELTAPYRDTPTAELDETGRRHLRSLAIAEQDLGRLLWEQGDPGCLPHFQAAYDLNRQIGDSFGQGIQASNLGNAYLFVPGLYDLDQAQHWHQIHLDLKPEHDRIGRAAGHGSLANVAYRRFRDARASDAPDAELLAHLNTALAGHRQALTLLPPDHHELRATAHNQLGVLYANAGDIAQAVRHYQQSIQHEETRDNFYGAGQSRYNIALLYHRVGRRSDARAYARAALDNFRSIGPGAADDVRDAEVLLRALQD
jgi:tetratricopeptide (TPR) repeat protein